MGSITHEIDARSLTTIIGRVGPTVRYGLWVERGRRPGKAPPIEAIAGWARRHGVNPVRGRLEPLLASGTRAQPFVEPSLQRNLPALRRMFGAHRLSARHLPGAADMTRLGDLRKGLKDRLATINGLQPYATMPANPQTPSAAVIPRSDDGAFSLDQDATVSLRHLGVRQFAGSHARADIDRRVPVDGWPEIIEAAIEADPSLGGVAHSAHITGWSDYAQIVDIGDAKVLGCRVDVEVMA